MSDTDIAAIARRLAEALAKFAYERDVESKKDVSRLQTELCSAVRLEQEKGEQA